MSILTAVKIQFNKNKDALVEAGYSLEDFADYKLKDFQTILADLGIGASAATSGFEPSSAPASTGANTNGAASTNLVNFMGIDVEKKIYGEGRDRRVYQNAKAFEGAAYMNVSLPVGNGKHLKLGAFNLQDFSELGPAEQGTKRGRAMLLRLLKEHGVTKCGTIKFEVELNVQALTEHDEEALDSTIVDYSFD